MRAPARWLAQTARRAGLVLGLLGGVAGAEEPTLPDPTAAPAPAPLPAIGMLEAARARYVALGDDWPPIGAGPPIHPGDADARVPAIRERLVVLGELPASVLPPPPEAVVWPLAGEAPPPPPEEGPFPPGTLAPPAVDPRLVHDPATVEGVRALQRHHGLEEDGIVGRQTLAALALTPAERVARIDVTLAGLRELPAADAPRFLVVHVPEFVLRVFEDGRQVDRYRVVVGNDVEDRATPFLHSSIGWVIFNPYWNVPDRIAIEEVLPNGGAWLEEHGYEIVSTGDGKRLPLDDASIALVGSGEARLRQKPGGENALGEVKFVFPNTAVVYLHDTPSKSLFDRSVRNFSHGCIRVDGASRLAAWILGPDGWTSDDVAKAERGDRERRVNLGARVPIHLVDWPAFVEPDGAVTFALRPYGAPADAP